MFLEYGLDLDLKRDDRLTIRETIASFGDSKLDEVIENFESKQMNEHIKKSHKHIN